jgi:hypothetical protein
MEQNHSRVEQVLNCGSSYIERSHNENEACINIGRYNGNLQKKSRKNIQQQKAKENNKVNNINNKVNNINNKGSEKQIQPGRYCNTKVDGSGSPDQKEFLSKLTEQNFKSKRCFAYRWQERSEVERKLDISVVRKGERGR